MYTSTTDEDIIQGSMKPAMRCVPASKNKFDHSKAFEIATEIKEDSTISFEDVYIYTSYALKQRGEEDEPFFIFMPQLNAVAEYDYDEIIVREITNIDDIYYDNWNKNSYSFMFDNDYKTLFYDFGVYDDKVELSDENYGVLNENNNTDK